MNKMNKSNLIKTMVIVLVVILSYANVSYAHTDLERIGREIVTWNKDIKTWGLSISSICVFIVSIFTGNIKLAGIAAVIGIMGSAYISLISKPDVVLFTAFNNSSSFVFAC